MNAVGESKKNAEPQMMRTFDFGKSAGCVIWQSPPPSP